MSSEQVLSLVAGAVALVALLFAARAHSRAAQADARAAALAERLAGLEATAQTATQKTNQTVSSSTTQPDGAEVREEPAYVITHVDDTARAVARPSDAAPIEPRLFADIVARETVAKAGGWAYGLRRALSPATRNRIRFEIRRETKRAGRERRAEMKQALREFRARERAEAAPLEEDVA